MITPVFDGLKFHLLAVLDAFAFPSTVFGFYLGNLRIARLEDLRDHLLGGIESGPGGSALAGCSALNERATAKVIGASLFMATSRWYDHQPNPKLKGAPQDYLFADFFFAFGLSLALSTLAWAR